MATFPSITGRKIYLLLLAPDGTILWRGQGAADEQQSAALAAALEESACGR